MSTDTLREALELKIDELLDEFVAELDRKTFEDYAQKRNTYSSRIAALAAPASETEKLPAKWRANKQWHGEVYAAELEAALKADRQGG